MTLPLCILPFDHRSSLCRDILDLPYPPTTSLEKSIVEESKQLLWSAFTDVFAQSNYRDHLGILVDEEFGSHIHAEATQRGIQHFLTLETSQPMFTLAYSPDELRQAVLRLQPTGCKVLVRYQVGQEGVNRGIRDQLLATQTLAHDLHLPLMLELLVRGPAETLAENLALALQELTHHNISPDIWKLEGLESRTDWKEIAKLVQQPIIVLGRGESAERVEHWLREAKASGLVRGFAVGRTLWANELKAWRQGTLSPEAARASIAKHYAAAIDLWMS